MRKWPKCHDISLIFGRSNCINCMYMVPWSHKLNCASCMLLHFGRQSSSQQPIYEFGIVGVVCSYVYMYFLNLLIYD